MSVQIQFSALAVITGVEFASLFKWPRFANPGKRVNLVAILQSERWMCAVTLHEAKVAAFLGFFASFFLYYQPNLPETTKLIFIIVLVLSVPFFGGRLFIIYKRIILEFKKFFPTPGDEKDDKGSEIRTLSTNASAELKAGTRVTHFTHGPGTVVDVLQDDPRNKPYKVCPWPSTLIILALPLLVDRGKPLPY